MMEMIDKINIDKKYLPALGRIFTPTVMDSLAQTGSSGYLTEVCTNSGLTVQVDPSMTLGQFFDWIYGILCSKYRNEYIYKNVIANKILLGKHSLNTSHLLTEFRVGKCKADVVVLNGTSTAYEIKSEFDSFTRLEKQVQSYLEIFDHVNVITSNVQVTKLKNVLPDKVGILVLTNRNTISTIRESEANKKNINPYILFDSLRKNEYIKVIKEYYGIVPDVPNALIYRACKNLFCKINPEIAHDATTKILRERTNLKVLKEFIEKAPSSLSAYAMTICTEKTKMEALMPRFLSSIGSVVFA
jgi:hypothetical protein